ncbi:MAG: single-stranded DNA-binding protein [Bacteroidales bacterium]|nr:single-stranded DNA-binding protein [Candidatus Egerieousia equi]MCQ2116908.1 single-stranded DNA-binding protein [Bacteroidales bacterium]
MERSMNKVELKGIVGMDPKITVIEGKGRVARFSVATHELFSAGDGLYKEETSWHNVVAWTSKYIPDFDAVKKGAFIELQGKLRYQKFKNIDGEDKYYTEILALKLVVPQR